MEEQVKYFFGDREVLFKAPTDGQIAALAKYVGIGQRSPERAVTSIGRIFEVIDNLIVKDDDRNFLEDEMIAGRLSPDELVKPLLQFIQKEEQQNKPVRRARRGS